MTVLIVDDHPLVRKGIISTLSTQMDVDVVGEASNARDAMTLLSNRKPDVTIIDLYLGKDNGLEVISKARQNSFQTKFIVLTTSSKKDDFDRARSMEVDGYILKEAFTDDIIYAFKIISRGKKYYDPTLVQLKFKEQEKYPLNELTLREQEVLEYLGKGLSNYQIAKSLYISENTVKKHISAILNKLELSRRTEAALYINNIN